MKNIRFVTYAILSFMVLLSACSTESLSTERTDNFTVTKSMNYENMGQIAESEDGTIFKVVTSEASEQIVEIKKDGTETCIVDGATYGLYAVSGGLFYSKAVIGTLWYYDCISGNATLITDMNIKSLTVIDDVLYLLGRESFEAPFKLFSKENNGALSMIELSNLPIDAKINQLFTVDSDLYLTADSEIYKFVSDNQVELIASFPEPLHKSFKLNGSVYAVGDNSIFQVDEKGEIESIAPKYHGMSTTVTVLDYNIVYSGIGGVYSYNTNTGQTRQISRNGYQEIYVIQGEVLGWDLTYPSGVFDVLQ